jgi:hypothetical protein
MDALSTENKFIIEREDLRLELEIARVDSLFLHERILSSTADKLLVEFKKQVNLEDPIIVDRNNIVLDGNHRAYVFKKLRIRYIPVCRIDYLHHSTRLRYWFRIIGNVRNPALLRKVVAELQGTFQDVEDRDALEKVMAEEGTCCGMQQGDCFAVIRFSEGVVKDVVTAYDVVEKLQERLIEEGLNVDYIPCLYTRDEEFCECLKQEEAILWTPRITKKMVIDAAGKEQLFAPKSTRHLIPARPIRVNVPVLWLNEDVSLEEINRRFVQFLRGKKVRHLPPGQTIRGRYYEEELFVFRDVKAPVPN